MTVLAKAIQTISELSERDYIEIISTYMGMTDPSYNCTLCKSHYKRDIERQRKHQERKGCFSTFPTPILKYRGGQNTPMKSASSVEYFQCPARFYSSFWANIINLHLNYDRGVMPFPGSVLEQPAKIVEAFNLIHNLKEETRIEQEEIAAKYGKRSKR